MAIIKWLTPTIAIFLLAPQWSWASCERNSATYQEQYHQQGFYIPDESTPVKTLMVNYHVLQNPDPDTTAGNFPDEESAKPFLEETTDAINNHLKNNREPSDPIKEVCSTDCHIEDTRLRVEMQDIYFTEHPRWDEGIYPGIPDFLFNNPGKELNIFLVMHEETSGSGRAIMPDYDDLKKRHKIISADIYDPDPEEMHHWATSKHLLHELGHIWGLHHTYSPSNETCDPEDQDFLADVLGPSPGPNCYHEAGWGCDIENTSCTNNLMGGTKSAGYLSPLQLGRIHRSLSVSSARQYAYGQGETEHKVKNDQHWDFDIKLYENLKLEPGTNLTITCQLLMAPDSKIIIPEGARLTLDGGAIKPHKNTDEFWQGVALKGDVAQENLSKRIKVKNGGQVINAAKGIFY